MDFAAYRTASALLPYAFPVKPMVTGRFDVKAVPAYVTFERDVNGPPTIGANDIGPAIDQSLSGAGAVLAVNYTAFENDWGFFGVGASALFFKEDGQSLGMVAGTPAAPVAFYGGETDRGEAFALTANWDPFKSPDGFRMPVLIGLSFTAINQFAVTEGALTAAQAPSGAGAGIGTYRSTKDVSLHSLGAMIGFSPQFNTGPVRWSPFAMLSIPFNKTTNHSTLENLSTGTPLASGNQVAPTVDPVPGVGLSVTYRPWGIGTMFTLPWVTQGAAAYALTLSKSFGGG